MKNCRIKLGQKVRDRVTGYEGVVDYIAEMMHDATKIGIQPPLDKKGKWQDCYSIDEHNIEVIDEKPTVEPITAEPKYNMGDKAECTITGFRGTIVAIVYYLNGCIHYRLQPKISKGGKAEDFKPQKFPEGVLKVKAAKTEYVAPKTGGPRMKMSKDSFFES